MNPKSIKSALIFLALIATLISQASCFAEQVKRAVHYGYGGGRIHMPREINPLYLPDKVVNRNAKNFLKI